MKVVRTQYLQFLLEPGRSTWEYTLDGVLVRADPTKNMKLRVYAAKVVIRNDFPTVAPGYNRFYVDDQEYILRQGSPDVLRFCREMNAICPKIAASFDSYDGSIIIRNPSKTASVRFNSDSIRGTIGFPARDIVIPPLGQVRGDFPVDLAPPETIVIRSNLIDSDASVEVSSDETRLSSALLFLGMDVSPQSTKLYTAGDGMYSHILNINRISYIKFWLEDVEGFELLPQNPITLILCVETLVDDEQELVKLQKESTELQRLQVIGSSLKKSDD